LVRRSGLAKRRADILLGAVAAAALAANAGAAHAQGLFDFLFGSHDRAPPPAEVSSYAEPAVAPPPRPETLRESSAGGSRTVTFCVRLCDGENFPMEHFANATPVETCRAMCPASKTKVFSGATIDSAVARDGARYADLDNAYLYRKHLVGHCTCNGRDAFGLAPFEMASDPTLRPGDIVVTPNGLMAYAGKRGQTATYTPVDPSRIMAQLNSVTSPPPRDAQNPEPPVGSAPRIIVESQNAPPQYLPPVVDLRGQAASNQAVK
jgi:hypothetical protein